MGQQAKECRQPTESGEGRGEICSSLHKEFDFSSVISDF